MHKAIIACDRAIQSMVNDVTAILKAHHVDITNAGDTEEIPDFTRSAEIAAKAVQSGAYDRGIVFCGSGIGVRIAANKFRGIRAGLAYEILPAAKGSSDYGTNILCTGAWLNESAEKCAKMIETWLMCDYSGADDGNIRKTEEISNTVEAKKSADAFPGREMPADASGSKIKCCGKKVAVGSDKNGIAVKNAVVCALLEHGYGVADVSADLKREESGPAVGGGADCGYFESVQEVCKAVRNGQADSGILISATGQEMNLTANKFSRIRSAVCFNRYTASLSRLDTNVNVLCMGAWSTAPEEAAATALTWMSVEYCGNNAECLKKIDEFELHG